MKKERQVYDNDTVCHYWANKIQDSARNANSNIYYENDIIYSYGSHFPVAAHFNDVVLFTEQRYSNTTSKHIRKVWSACSHKEIILCSNPRDAVKGHHNNNIDVWINEIKIIVSKKLPKARKADKYIFEIQIIKDKLNKYLSFFNLNLSKEDEEVITFSNAEEFIEKAKKASEEAKIKELQDIEKSNILWQQYKKLWRKGKEIKYTESLESSERKLLYAYPHKETWLRLIKDDSIVNTNKGVDIPVNVAKRYYAFYKRIVKNGGCNKDCNYKMLEYDVSLANEERLVVGCHDILSSEIEYIAKKLKWS